MSSVELGVGVRLWLDGEARSPWLGVSVRTLKRWASGYRDAGVAGLADARLLS